MRLIIDIGNTFTKLALFDSNKLIKEYKGLIVRIEEVEGFIGSTEITSSILSTVSNDTALVEQIIGKYQTLLCLEIF